MSKKLILITGANSGIGKAAALQLAEQGHRVILGCRNRDRGESALKEIEETTGKDSAELLVIDMSLQSSIRRAAEEVLKKFSGLDAVIHNAAAFDITQKKPVYTAEGVESVWATNHVGPVLLTELLLAALKKSGAGRIITVASKGLVMHPRLTVDFKNPEFRNRPFSVPKAYYQSKLAQVMYTYWLAENLAAAGITANCVRVTNVKIDLDNRYRNISKAARFVYALKSKGSITPEEMAKTYVRLAVSDEAAELTGKYIDKNQKEVSSSSWSMNKGNIDALMTLTRRYIDTGASSRKPGAGDKAPAAGNPHRA